MVRAAAGIHGPSDIQALGQVMKAYCDAAKNPEKAPK
jgi:hypothetical protein